MPQSGYGMTETCSHQYTLPTIRPKLIVETCGRACPGYEIRIWRQDNPDIEAAVGEVGQIGGRGASLMLGYFDDQIGDRAVVQRPGWFMTGDLGWLDENGYLRITGRKKDIIIRGGHNIYPAPIEALARATRRSRRWPRSRSPMRVSASASASPWCRAPTCRDLGVEPAQFLCNSDAPGCRSTTCRNSCCSSRCR